MQYHTIVMVKQNLTAIDGMVLIENETQHGRLKKEKVTQDLIVLYIGLVQREMKVLEVDKRKGCAFSCISQRSTIYQGCILTLANNR